MKKREKKLQLNRETVLQLDARQISKVNGGIDWTGCMSECTECGGGGIKGFEQIGN